MLRIKTPVCRGARMSDVMLGGFRDTTRSYDSRLLGTLTIRKQRKKHDLVLSVGRVCVCSMLQLPQDDTVRYCIIIPVFCLS